VRYWDTSGLVQMMARQPGWELAEDWAATDETLVTSWLTKVECWSAFTRLLRMEAMDERALALAAHDLDDVLADAHQVVLSEAVRDEALALLQRHPLRAADALHLASALTWADGVAIGNEFVTFDRRLAEAARREGFTVLTDGD
jgi:uncharacterized protein